MVWFILFLTLFSSNIDNYQNRFDEAPPILKRRFFNKQTHN
ncbi:hypothetical protein HMPREF1400_00584 [Helicobacter pylori GAM119Bi]|nr:hypothetical protein HMPREF1400_00584 [Helicobacter pylori GAM119Bi]EMH00935.1 hypothetical protein HMPREF1402_00011 [Helicobacter pylori GAM121Aii]